MYRIVAFVQLGLTSTGIFFAVLCKEMIASETFQVFLLTMTSILAVLVAAIILICLPDFLSGRSHKNRRGRRRTRDRAEGNKPRPANYYTKELQQDDQNLIKPSLKSTRSFALNGSRSKIPSMPPLRDSKKVDHETSESYTLRNKISASSNSIPVVDNVPLSIKRKKATRRHSLPPRLSSRMSLSTDCLYPIVERKLEDYDDYWWKELDSRTQYYALILGYTPSTWDDDLSLEDLACEDWYWDEMTTEQRAAAKHFGYDQDSWDD